MGSQQYDLLTLLPRFLARSYPNDPWRFTESPWARLAVASAVAFIDFAAETYAQRESLRSLGTPGKAD